jgi:hypothetical protein
MERTIADIQLFGSASQVEMAQSFAMEFSKSGTASLDSLLSELRQSLRAELNLEAIPPKLLYLRLGQPPRIPGYENQVH